jgi:hypothetical protein
MANETLDEVLKKYGESAGVRKQNAPQREEPTRYQVEREKEGMSPWSGGWAGGRSR